MKEVVINTCYGGFGLSDLAYEKLIEYGVPVRKYINEKRGKNGFYKKEPKNEGKIIFDRKLTPKGEDAFNDIYWEYEGKTRLNQRYWDTWLRKDRTNPLLIKVVKELKKKANGECANLKIVKIPNDVKFTIEEYDGIEHVAEEHRTWN